MSFSIKNLSKELGGSVLFDGVSISCDDDKICIIGINGAGKTTLLKIVAGVTQPDSGKIVVADWMQRLYVSQEFKSSPDTTVRQLISSNGDDEMRAVSKILSNTSCRIEDYVDHRLGNLSGGQRRLIQLARAFCSGAQILALDEPENHLDYRHRLWLIEQINNYWGDVLVVSHDQYIIDQISTAIWEVEASRVNVYSGTYANYLEQKQAVRDGQARRYAHWQQEIKRHKDMVRRLKDIAKINSDTAGSYRNKKKKLQRLEEDEPQSTGVVKQMIIHTPEVDRKSGKRVVTLVNLGLSFSGNTIFEDANLDLRYGEKVLFFGQNGSGKTSLIKIILKNLLTDANVSGKLQLGNDLQIKNYVQEHNNALDSNNSPLQHLVKNPLGRGDERKVRSLLAKFAITSDLADRPLYTLSGGERARVRFADLFLGNPDVLILDEPTNDLDVDSQQVLLEALKSYEGTIILVSHNRNFADKVCEKVWVFENQTIKDFPGTLSEYLDRELR